MFQRTTRSRALNAPRTHGIASLHSHRYALGLRAVNGSKSSVAGACTAFSSLGAGVADAHAHLAAWRSCKQRDPPHDYKGGLGRVSMDYARGT